MLSPLVISAVLLAVPVPLFLTGLLAGFGPDRHPRLIRTLSAVVSAPFAFVCAMAAAAGYAAGARGLQTYPSVALPAGMGTLALGVYTDPLTIVMLLLVTFVGLIVSRYSSSYMDGDEHEGKFHRWLSLTLGSFLVLVMTSNFWVFAAASFATTASIRQLLYFYKERPGAALAAQKKSLFSGIANAAMLVAFLLVAITLHTSDFGVMRAALAPAHFHLSPTLEVASGMVALSAMLKSAQFPTHGWLIQVMEAPTPVSALLHAGVIYTGPFLVLRMSPLMARAGWTGDILVLVGLTSVVVGSMVMMTATAIKSSLAYSTLGQMGFMLMECGLGLYSVAVLHIVSHSLYKAHAFLASGSVVDHFREPALPSVFNASSARRAIVGLVVAVGMTFGIGSTFGIGLDRQPALFALGLVVALAITHLLLQALNSSGSGTKSLIVWMAGLSAAVIAAYFGLHRAFAILLAPSLPPARLPSSVGEYALLVLIVAVFLGLLAVQQVLPRVMSKPRWRAAYVHMYNGLYVDLALTRVMLGKGSAPARQAPIGEGEALPRKSGT